MSRRTITANVTGKAYKRTLNGREYYVVPMSMLVPGVLHGSKGPLYYPPEEVTKGYTSWNGMPIVLDHPTQNGVGVSARSPGILDQYGVGYVFNATKAKGKLDAEGWFDIDKSNQVDPRIIASIERNQPFELSTGLFTDNIPEEGVHNGRHYTHVAKNYRPDHLAVFFGKKGACSLNDGCGVLVNEDFDESKVKRADDGKFGSGAGSSKASSSGKADASAIAQVQDYMARGGKKKKKPSEKKVGEKKLKAVASPKVKATDIKGGSKGAGASGPAKVIDELGKMNSGKQTIAVQQADGSVVNIPNPHFKGDGKVAGKKPGIGMTKNEAQELIENMTTPQRKWFFANLGGGGGKGGGGGGKGGKGKATKKAPSTGTAEGMGAKKGTTGGFNKEKKLDDNDLSGKGKAGGAKKATAGGNKEIDKTIKEISGKIDKLSAANDKVAAAKSKLAEIAAGKESLKKTASAVGSGDKAKKFHDDLLPLAKPTATKVKEVAADKSTKSAAVHAIETEWLKNNKTKNIPQSGTAREKMLQEGMRKGWHLKSGGDSAMDAYTKKSSGGGPQMKAAKPTAAKVKEVAGDKPALGQGPLGTVSSKYKGKSVPELRAAQKNPNLSLKEKMDIKHAISVKTFKPKAKTVDDTDDGGVDQAQALKAKYQAQQKAQFGVTAKELDNQDGFNQKKPSVKAPPPAGTKAAAGKSSEATAAVGNKPSIGDLVGGFNPGAAKTIGDKTSLVKTTFAKGDHTKFRNAMKDAGYSTMPGKTANETLHKGPSGDIVRIKKGPNGSTQVEQIVSKGSASASASSSATPAFQTKVNGKWVDGLQSTGKQTTEASLAKDIFNAGDAKTMAEAKMMAYEEMKSFNASSTNKRTNNALHDDHVGSSVVFNQRRANMAQFTPQEREEVLDGLVGNCSCEATAKADRVSLNALSDQALARLALNAGLGETDDLVELEEAGTVTGNSQPMTTNEWLATAPAEVQSVVRNAMAQEKKEKTDLVSTITANSRNVFSDKQLMAKSVDELRGLAALAGEPTPSYRPAPNYAGVAGYGGVANYGASTSNAATKEEPLMAPTMNFLDENKAE